MKKRVFRGVGLCAMLLCLSLSLCGCMFEQSEGMYALPILPEAYSQLQSTIQDVMDQQGAEYATISSGSNTSTVQLLDLNGDGEQEMAAVFLRVTSAEEKPLRVCLFRKGADNDYRLTYVVEGDGTSINSVTYEDVTGDGTLDLIVSWQMSTKVHILSAYALLDAGVSELMSTTYNESYLVTDLDQDGAKEIVVCHQDSTGDGANLAEFYDYNGGVMTMTSSAPLSNGIYGVYSMVPGKLADGTPAVFASSLFSGGTLTDVMTVADGRLHNVTLNKQAGYSEVTSRADTGVSLSDINKDGVLEQKPTLVNLQCDIDHPTQCMADMLHIIHHFGGVENLKGKKIAMTWAYSPSYGKPLSVPQGIIGLMSRFGMDVVLAHPEGYEIMPEVEKIAEENAKSLQGIVVQIQARAGQGGRLFGAVTSQEISDALREQHGIEIEKNKIVQAEPIKQFGSFAVKARLGSEISGVINVLVTEKK